MNPQKEATPLLSSTNLLWQAMSFYKEKFWTLILVMLVPQLPIVLYIIVLKYSDIASFLDIKVGANYAIFFILISIGQVWAQVSLIQAMKDDQVKTSALTALRMGLSKLHYYYLVYAFVVPLVAIGLVFFILPGLYLVALFGIGIIIFVVEDQGWSSAVSKSSEYIKGRWLSILWRSLFILLLSFLLFLFMPPTMKLLGFSAGNNEANFISMMSFFVLLTPLLIVYLFSIYRNLKTNNDNVGVALYETPKRTSFLIDILILVAVFVVLISYHTFAKSLFPDSSRSPQSIELTQETALKLVSDILPYRDCASGGVAGEYNTCRMSISKDHQGNVWTIHVVYEGLTDGKTEAIKITALTNYHGGRFIAQSYFKSQKCLPGHGYHDFSAATCL